MRLATTMEMANDWGMKKRIVLALAGLFLVHSGFGETPLLTPYLNCTFRILYSTNSGAAFTVELDNRQYLVTAKHLVAGVTNGSAITLIKKKGELLMETVKPIFCEDTNVDIVVLALKQPLKPKSDILPTMDNATLGQDVYVFGFPQGYYTEAHDYIMPFVGKGILSASDTTNPNAVKTFFHFTVVGGFSGGPIGFVDRNTRQLKVGAVVSGFNSTKYPVLRGGLDTGMEAIANPGIMVGYNIDHAVAAIRKNPIGPKVE